MDSKHAEKVWPRASSRCWVNLGLRRAELRNSDLSNTLGSGDEADDFQLSTECRNAVFY